MKLDGNRSQVVKRRLLLDIRTQHLKATQGTLFLGPSPSGRITESMNLYPQVMVCKDLSVAILIPHNLIQSNFKWIFSQQQKLRTSDSLKMVQKAILYYKINL